MKIYFLRHGEADWPDWNKPDDERPLTSKGRKEMKRVAKFLCDLDPGIDCVLTSPLPRAKQTAEIVADYLDLKLEEEPALAKGFNAAKLRKLLADRKKAANVMVVGHEPNFSAVIRELTGGNVKLSKAGLAVVDLAGPVGKGELVLLIPPKIAKL